MIKCEYRAWIKSENRMFYPTMIDFDNECAWNQIAQTSESGEWYSFDDIILMQSVGKQDSNGKDIYDKDVLEETGKRVIYKDVIRYHGDEPIILQKPDRLEPYTNIGTVKWNKRGLNWIADGVEFILVPDFTLKEEVKIEIVGNVLENPEWA